MAFDHYPNVQAAKGLATRNSFHISRGEQTLEEASERLKQATRRFAKRQLTWFRNRMQVTFIRLENLVYKTAFLARLRSF